MSRLSPHDFSHIFNYNNLTITPTQIYCTPKKKQNEFPIEWPISFFFYLSAKCTYFSLNILRVFSAPPKKFIFTHNLQTTCTISMKIFLSVRYVNPHVWYKNYKKMLREHAENCDVPSSPCPIQPRSPLVTLDHHVLKAIQ